MLASLGKLARVMFMTVYQRFGDLLEKATAQTSRSTVVGPLIVVLGILLAGTLGSFLVGAPLWLNLGLSISSALILFLFGGAYLYFMFRSPDALRSEKFSIQKMVIERGLLGDDTTDLLDIEPALRELKTVSSTAPDTPMIEGEK